MAENLDDGEFWLPSQFLVDDDNMLHQKPRATTNKNIDQNCLGSTPFQPPRSSFPLEFGTFGGFSDFGSSGESLKGSSETESDEEESVAGLTTLRVARSSIDDTMVLSRSPQSTLCDMGSGSGCSQVSSRGSPKGNCKTQSPPATWDLLHAAAEEVARMRIKESHGVLHHNRGPSQVSVPVKTSTTGTGFYQQLQALQFQHLQQKEIMQRQNLTVGEQINSPAGYQHQHIHQMVPNGVRGCRGFSSPAWLPPPQGSGMRTLFLGTQGGKRECAGTGVFLPRHTTTQSEQRRKPACSTVLVPARVMQALNLNYDDICSQPHLQPVAGGRFDSKNDVLLRLEMNRGGNYQKHNSRRQSPTEHEIKLPQEWTY
ncbi:uncharacterized protein E5676_scaffold352G001260 [Cucumis melo var. makuwa]|uniref:TIP41-like protein n=2 Tax=Cucumis melo TaxID=3656 RepID=A0A5A7TLP2_CUCMM|nr:uncharacterized protein E6C27_scaffold236G004830 [Cucumis melo var. makuwa]TYK25008.1 uncharacterized protein E5676_scaffold352G001260 [Cucumis melo var. makuwa]